MDKYTFEYKNEKSYKLIHEKKGIALNMWIIKDINTHLSNSDDLDKHLIIFTSILLHKMSLHKGLPRLLLFLELNYIYQTYISIRSYINTQFHQLYPLIFILNDNVSSLNNINKKKKKKKKKRYLIRSIY